MVVVEVPNLAIVCPPRCVACYGVPTTDYLKVKGGGAKTFIEVKFPLCAECAAAMRTVQPKGELHTGLGLRFMHGNVTDEDWKRASRISDSVSVMVGTKSAFSSDKTLVAKFTNEAFAALFDSTNKFYHDPKVQQAAAALRKQQLEAAKAAAHGKK